MRECDKKRIKKLKANQKFNKCYKSFKQVFIPLDANLEAQEAILIALNAIPIGALKLLANSPDRFGEHEAAKTVLVERIFKLSQ